MNEGTVLNTSQNMVVEVVFNASMAYKDPFNDVDLDMVVTDPDGEEFKVPAFWSGKNVWKARYASPKLGIHTFSTLCSDPSSDLHRQAGKIKISENRGDNILFKHGPITVSANGRHFEHADKTPFLWLGEPWYMVFTNRIGFDDFKDLVKDRIDKGYNVIQIVAAYPAEIDPFDPIEVNEGGHPWTEGFGAINPSYWDYADRKLDWLVRCGMSPCIFGAWGYHVDFMGIEKMKKHWRYIIARWGAYPVTWVSSGEARMPHYDVLAAENLSYKSERETGRLGKIWTEITAYMRATDPFKRPVSVMANPGDFRYSAREIYDDHSLFDYDYVCTDHYDELVFDLALRKAKELYSTPPVKPFLNGETCWEGMSGANWQDTQRFIYWTHMLSGAAGHSHGASGLWNFHEKDDGWVGAWAIWSDQTWREAKELPGAYQMGLGKKLLETFEWHRFEPHPDWCTPHSSSENVRLPYAAGIPGQVRLIYFPGICFMKDIYDIKNFKIINIEKGTRYLAYFFNPRTGEKLSKMKVEPDEHGTWRIPKSIKYEIDKPNPTSEDWVLVLENK